MRFISRLESLLHCKIVQRQRQCQWQSSGTSREGRLEVGGCIPGATAGYSRIQHRRFGSPSVNDSILISHLQNEMKGIVLMKLNRPTVKNAINFAMLSKLNRAVEDVKFDRNVRVVVLCSAVEDTFCAGADLKERRVLSSTDYKRWSHTIRAVTTNLSELSVPIIAAIDGYALGGGLELALACDLRVAASTAKMGLPETGLAIIPGAGGTQRLPRVVGPSVAKDLILTGRIFDGQEAHRIGAVNYVVPQDSDGTAAYKKAITIATILLQKGPVALQLAKTAINKGSEVDLHTGLAIERACYDQLIPTEDRLEALEAFADKRTPQYKGR